MTEAEWLRCDDPDKMLKFVQGKASERKLRLFHVSCCRRVWHVLPDERSRHAVDVVEGYADGLADLASLQDAAADAVATWAQDDFGAPAGAAAEWLLERPPGATILDPGETGEMVVCVVAQLAFEGRWAFSDGVRREDSEAAARDERAVQAKLLRDIIGNPFQAVVSNHAWLAWNGAAVRNMAQAIYDERAFDRLPILGDALEDAGCANEELLSHCRSAGEHVRGCWVVDLLLGKG